MAYIKQNDSGSWTAQIDMKGSDGHKVRMKKTFSTQALAESWARIEEGKIETKATGKYVAPEGTVGELIDNYVRDYGKVKGGWSDSKQEGLDKLKALVGDVAIKDFDKAATIALGKTLGETRGPVGVGSWMASLSKVFKVGFDHYEIDTPREAFRSGMAVLRELGIVGATDPRDRVIEEWETAKIKEQLGKVMQDVLDTLAIVPFRVGELCDIRWAREDATGKTTSDFNEINRSVRLFRKDTSKNKKTYKKMVWVVLPEIETIKDGKVVTVDTFDLLFNRPKVGEGPFAIDGKEASRQFCTAHKMAGIADIHLHDYRAEAISSLLSQGFGEGIVAELSGHEDLTVLRRHYNRQKPRKLHELFKRQNRLNRQARAA